MVLSGGVAVVALSPSDWIRIEAIYVVTASLRWATDIVAPIPYVSGGFFHSYPSGVLWTLTVELTFYLAVPFLGMVAARSRRGGTVLVAGLAAASVIFLLAIAGTYPHDHWIEDVRITVLPYFWMFAIGMLFRLWWAEIAAIRFVFITAFAIFSIAVIRSGFSWLDWKVEPEFLDMLKTGLVCLMALLVGISPLLRAPILVRNDISYGVYLWHMLFVSTAVALGWTGSFWVASAAGAATLLVAWGSWRFVEKPALGLKRARPLTAEPKISI